MFRTARLPAAAALLLAAPALGQSLFGVQLSQTGNPSNNATIGGPNLINLVDQAVNTTGSLSGFATVDTTMNVRYGDLNNAITITKNAANTQATLTLGPTGFSRTFTGTSQAGLERQIEDFLKTQGGAALRDFMRAVNGQSLIAVSDGNPNSTTARMADYTFVRFGMHGAASDPDPDQSEVDREKKGLGVRLDAWGGFFNAGDFDGETAQAAV